MSKLFVLHFVFIACYTSLVCTSSVGSRSKCEGCEEPKSPLINWLADFSNKYKQIHICDYKCDSRAVRDDEGRWYVSYRAVENLKSDEEADELCECMKKFLLQEGGWTEGSVAVCKAECTSLTVFIIGARNPENIDRKPVTETCEPLKILGSALKHYPDAQLAGKRCNSTTGFTSTGQFRITSECENDPNPEETCENMFEYMNSENWLDDTTSHECTVKNNKIYLEIVENADVGDCY